MELIPKPKTYRGLDLASNSIDTLILSGGGYYGLAYIGVIKLLEDKQIIHNIKSYIGVSIGSLVALLAVLGYSADELKVLIQTDIKLSKILEINADNVFNIFDKMGINTGAYIEETIKTLIAARGYSPYITLEKLQELTGKSLHVGFTRCFRNQFILAGPDSEYKDMPVWLAVRASISLPIILEPVADYLTDDLLVDGGLINNNPIKPYLEKWWSSQPHHSVLHPVKRNTRDVGIQCDIAASECNIDINNNSSDLSTTSDLIPTCKYKQGFLCIDLYTRDYIKPEKCNLADYMGGLISKIFANQEPARNKYAPYIMYLNCTKYGLGSTLFNGIDITADTIDYIINDAYLQLDTYLASITR